MNNNLHDFIVMLAEDVRADDALQALGYAPRSDQQVFQRAREFFGIRPLGTRKKSEDELRRLAKLNGFQHHCYATMQEDTHYSDRCCAERTHV